MRGASTLQGWIPAASPRGAPSGNGLLRAIVGELSLTRGAGQFNRNAAPSESKRTSTGREFCPVQVMLKWGDSLKHLLTAGVTMTLLR